MAGMDPTVRLAHRIWQEDQGQVQGATDASAAFRATGQSVESLYGKAASQTSRYRLAGGLVGAFIGLVIVGKAVRLSVWRRRPDYEANRAACLACARCYVYCPMEHQRRKRIQEGQIPS